MSTNNISLKEQIYTSILNGIILGEYTSDQVLNEKGLMEKFNVSRAPIREALIALCNENVLYSIPYYGYKITTLTDEDVASVKSYRDILECGFMRDHWSKFTPDVVDHLEELFKENTNFEREDDAIGHWNENIRFHLEFFNVYGNEYAYKNLHSAMSIQTRAYAQSRWNEWHTRLFHEAPAFHGLILDAIRKNEQETAIQLLHADIISI